MWLLWIFIGLLLGFATGFVFAVWAQYEMDQRSVRDGVIKLCGKFYTLNKIDL